MFTKDTQSVYVITSHNDEDVDLDVLVMKQVVSDKLVNPILPEGENEITCDVDTFGAISLIPRLSCILKLKLN